MSVRLSDSPANTIQFLQAVQPVSQTGLSRCFRWKLFDRLGHGAGYQLGRRFEFDLPQVIAAWCWGVDGALYALCIGLGKDGVGFDDKQSHAFVLCERYFPMGLRHHGHHPLWCH